MIKLTKKWMLITSGTLWFLIGFMLLKLGLGLVVNNVEANLAIFLICLGLVVGFAKGRFVLGKAVKRTVDHLEGLTDPVPLTSVYTPKYGLLILCMMGLGMSMRYFGISDTLRGTIDVAIGSALLQGAMLYFRNARLAG